MLARICRLDLLPDNCGCDSFDIDLIEKTLAVVIRPSGGQLPFGLFDFFIPRIFDSCLDNCSAASAHEQQAITGLAQLSSPHRLLRRR